MTTPAMIYGKPVGSRAAADAMANDLAAGFREAKKPRRGGRDRVEAQYEQFAQSVVDPIFVQAGDAPDALSIVEARVIRFDSGTTFETPVIRVPICNVTAWFIGTFKLWKSGAAPLGNATPPLEPPDDLDSRPDLPRREF